MSASLKSPIVGLRRVESGEPGITRIRRGKGFGLRDADGRPVDDLETIERIRKLAIPPAWRDVWICADANGHIQATGFDARNRLQYRYHDEWRRQRDEAKFEEMIEFSQVMPLLRTRVRGDISKKGLSRERVLACAVRLLDQGFIRVGGEAYATENGTHGLATLRRDHVELEFPDKLHFDFIAKSNKARNITLRDRSAFSVLAELQDEDPAGKRLLSYRDGDWWVDIRADDVNEYIKVISGGDFTAKDFRTLNATVLASIFLAVQGEVPESETRRKRVITTVLKSVSEMLGNTPAVCRASYIDPRLWERYAEGKTIPDVTEADALSWPLGWTRRRVIEETVVDLLVGDDDTLTINDDLLGRVTLHAVR
jgi:DNA topoisomerase IB